MFEPATTEAAPAPVPASSVPAAGISVDDFQALEQRVLRAVEIVRRERDARAAAEAAVARLTEQVSALKAELAAVEEHNAATHNEAQTQLQTLHQERDAVRLRVEKMLQQMDELL
jgi:hypothetical protein